MASHCRHHHHKKRPKISLLIPFSSKDPIRRETFRWLLAYWKQELPDAEVVIGKSSSKIFCKGEALNNAVRRSHGRVLVVLDADAYISGIFLEYCANLILEDLPNHLWYVPYRSLYRLTPLATDLVISSDPADPFRIPNPPPPEFIENHGHTTKYGHRYGAMCMMFPREAYDILGCFDERFKGWGGEDVALLRALDTLWGKHKSLNAPIFHLWHPFIGDSYQTRKWVNQPHSNTNSRLAQEYHKSSRHPSKMRRLVDEGCKCARTCHCKHHNPDDPRSYVVD